MKASSYQNQSNMLALPDLKKLAEMSTSERAFLSVYLAGPHSVDGLEKKFERIRRLLKTGPEKDEKSISTTTSVRLQSIWIDTR